MEKRPPDIPPEPSGRESRPSGMRDDGAHMPLG
jgi:hypothetical protein